MFSKSPASIMKTSVIASVLFAFLALIDQSFAQTAAAAANMTSYIQIVTTTILLPSALFTSAPLRQNFSGFISSSSSTTFYTVWPNPQNNFTDFGPNFVTHYNWSGYPFSASAAGTQFVWQDLTINCPPTITSFKPVCTTTSIDLDKTNPPSYNTLTEPSFYTIELLNHQATDQTPSTSPKLLKISIGLSAPLGICLCVLTAVLIYRHREHKLRSRNKHNAAFMGRASIADGMKDVKMVDGVDGGRNGFAAYGGAGAGENGSGVREIGPGARAVDGPSEAFSNELDGVGRNGRGELA
ncbi:hypothetical protein BDR22DRAFT_826147 [Usnea florida]